MKKFLVVLALIGLLVTPMFAGGADDAAGSGQTESSVSAVGQGTLSLYVTRSLETLNPHMYQASATGDLLEKIYANLYRIVPTEDKLTYRIIAELAEGDPTMLDDSGLSWEIKIRPNITWSNGEVLDAEDVGYSWKMLLDPVLINEKSDIFDERGIQIVGADEYRTQGAGGTVSWESVGIKVVDNLTVKLELDKPISLAALKSGLCDNPFAMVNDTLYEAGMNSDRTETTYGTSLESVAFSGPYILTDWVRDSEYIVRKNPDSVLADMVHLAAIRTMVIGEAGTAVQLFESGQLDSVGLDTATYARYAEDPRLVVTPYRTVYHMVINTIAEDNRILQNRKFRQALSYGTNRDEIGTVALVEPANYFVTDYYVSDILTGTFYRDTPQAQSVLHPNHGYDPEMAFRLFNEALAEEGLDNVSLQIDYHDGRESRKLASEYIQKAWPDLFGRDRLEVALQAVPSSQLSSKLRSHVDDPNAFDLGWTGSSFNFFDHTSVLNYFHTNTGRRKWPYFSDEYDALVEQMRLLPIEAVDERLVLSVEMEALLLEDVPSIPVFRPISFTLFAEEVELPLDKYNPIIGWGLMWAKKGQ